jgi:hypothetical protein
MSLAPRAAARVTMAARMLERENFLHGVQWVPALPHHGAGIAQGSLGHGIIKKMFLYYKL